MELLLIVTLLLSGAGIGMILGDRQETRSETRRNVRQEMKYEQASV